MQYMGDSAQRYADAYWVQAPIRAWAAEGGVIVLVCTRVEGCRGMSSYETLERQYDCPSYLPAITHVTILVLRSSYRTVLIRTRVRVSRAAEGVVILLGMRVPKGLVTKTLDRQCCHDKVFKQGVLFMARVWPRRVYAGRAGICFFKLEIIPIMK